MAEFVVPSMVEKENQRQSD